MKGYCLRTVRHDIEEIIMCSPADSVPMFDIVSGMDIEYMSERVIFFRDKLYDPMTSKQVKGLQAENLMFIKYIKNPLPEKVRK